MLELAGLELPLVYTEYNFGTSWDSQEKQSDMLLWEFLRDDFETDLKEKNKLSLKSILGTDFIEMLSKHILWLIEFLRSYCGDWSKEHI